MDTEPYRTDTSADRYALYYPYIHIRNENWLKGTILGFQQVRRIVPSEFNIKDAPITAPYAELEGPAGPLLKAESVDSSQIRETQTWLHNKISDRLSDLKSRYGRTKTPENLEGGPDAFQMHTGKFVDRGLLELLKQHDLAWHSRDPMEPDSFNWVTMHPRLGSATMSVLAIAVARVRGLSVVTPSGRAHHNLLANREEAVFDKLVDNPDVDGEKDESGVVVEELAHVVITTGFDLTRLQPKDILELINEGKDLRSFRLAVQRYAQRIPPGVGHEERIQRLKQHAEEILDEWDQYTNSLPSFARGAIVDTTLEQAPGKLIEAGLKGGAAKAVGLTVLATLPGLVLSIVVAAGVKMLRRADTPLRYLSRINDLAEHRIGSIYVPQWSALTAQSGEDRAWERREGERDHRSR